MKKKLLSLTLTLALCLGLSVPVFAAANPDEYPSIRISTNGEDPKSLYKEGSGDGWEFKYDAKKGYVLTLNGVKNLILGINRSITIVLAEGSKNHASHIVQDLVYDPDMDLEVTFEGTGELEIDGSQWKLKDFYDIDISPFYGKFTKLDFKDNLAMVGGDKKGDTKDLVLGAPGDYEHFGFISRMITTTDSQSVGYIHIVPKSNIGAPNKNDSEDTHWSVAIDGFDDVPKDSPYSRAITWAVEFGFAKGKTPRTFGPNDPCKISHILTFLYRDYTIPNEYQATLSEREAVANWAKQDFPKLITDADNLDGFCTRAMAVTFLWKLAGSPVPAKTTSFADIPADAPYAQAVAWAVERGVTNGYGANFLPDKICTRGQIVTFMMRARIVSEG